jgi:hypothetical protein
MADDIFEEAKFVFPKLMYKKYAVVSGTQTQYRISCKGPAIKQFITYPTPVYQNGAGFVIRTVLSFIKQSVANSYFWTRTELVNKRWDFSRILEEELSTRYGQSVQDAMDALSCDPDSLKKAQIQADRLRRKYRAKSRRTGAKSIARLIKKFDFSKQELLDIWGNVQISQILES